MKDSFKSSLFFFCVLLLMNSYGSVSINLKQSLLSGKTSTNCLLDTVDNVILTLQTQITTYFTVCGINDKNEMKNLLLVAQTIGKAQAKFIKSKRFNLLDIDAVISLSTSKFASVSAMLTVNPQTFKQEDFDGWYALLVKDLLSLGKDKGYPVFFTSSGDVLFRFSRYLEVFKGYDDKTQCLSLEYVEIYLDMINDPLNKQLDVKSLLVALTDNTFKIDPSQFANGGFAFSFLVQEDYSTIPAAGVPVLSGYINSQKKIELVLTPSSSYTIKNTLTLESDVSDFSIGSMCSDLVFYLVTIEKDCDHYKFSVYARSVSNNKSYSITRNAQAHLIEYLSLNFASKYVINAKVYKNFKYSTDGEKRIMIYQALPKMQDIISIATQCQAIPNCAYYTVDKKCLGCLNKLFLYVNSCVEKCPQSYFPKIDQCLPCGINCTKCSTVDICDECMTGFKILPAVASSSCVNNCPTNTFEVNGKCVACSLGKIMGTNGVCTPDPTLKSTAFVTRVDLWNDETFSYSLSSPLPKQFSITLWLRKKTHSNFVNGRDTHGILSYMLSDQTTKPLISEKILGNTFTSELNLNWGKTVSAYKHVFDSEVYDYFHIVLLFDNLTSTLKYVMKDFSANQVINQVNSFSDAAFQKLILGDAKGAEINFEVSWLQMIPYLLDDNEITAQRAAIPIDCDPACKSCDISTGMCNTCGNGTGPAKTCSLYMWGFNNTNIYNYNDISKVPNPKDFMNSLKDNGFAVGVNSAKYSCMGHAKFLKMSGNKRYRIISLGNIKTFSVEKNKGRGLIRVDIVMKGTYGIPEFIVNDGGEDRAIQATDVIINPGDWYTFYAAVDVVGKLFQYMILDGQRKSYSGQLQLKNLMENIQEIGGVSAFGIPEQESSSVYDMTTLRLQNAYCSPNIGYNSKLLSKFVQSFPTLPEPVCEQGCEFCIYNNSSVNCGLCKTGYVKSAMGVCTK